MKTGLVNNGVFIPVDDIQQGADPTAEGFYWIDATIEDLAVLQPCSRFTISPWRTA